MTTTLNAPDISVALCVINYNGAHCIARTLAAACAQDKAFSEIVVVDNASRDNSIEVVQRQFPEARILALPQNLGPGPARNAGLQSIAGRWILFLDNDVFMNPNCVDRLLKAMAEADDAAAAMPRIIYDQERTRIQYDGADCHYLGFMSLRNSDVELSRAGSLTCRMNSIVTACFLYDRTRWPDDRPFDAALPIYYEDHDFGMRLRLAGNAILAVPEARAYHGGGTPGLSYRTGGPYYPRRIKHLVLNRWQILMKNFAGRTLVLILPMLLVYELFQLIGLVKKGWLRPWTGAVRQIIALQKQIAGRRRYVQKLRQLPDRHILQGGPIPFTANLAGSPVERFAKRALDALANGYWTCIYKFL